MTTDLVGAHRFLHGRIRRTLVDIHPRSVRPGWTNRDVQFDDPAPNPPRNGFVVRDPLSRALDVESHKPRPEVAEQSSGGDLRYIVVPTALRAFEVEPDREHQPGQPLVALQRYSVGVIELFRGRQLPGRKGLHHLAHPALIGRRLSGTRREGDKKPRDNSEGAFHYQKWVRESEIPAPVEPPDGRTVRRGASG